MALSGSNSVNIGNQYVKLRVVWNATQNIANNQSTITASLYLDLTGASMYVGSRTDSYINIDGLNLTISAPAINVTDYTGSILLGTVSRTITHNADGTKSLTVTGVWTARATINGTYYATVSVTDTDTLDTIPRASQPTLSNDTPTLGDTITIYTHRASSAFTHTLKYTFGTQSGTITTNLPTDYAWTIPLTLANGLPNATSGSGVITCETYEGTTLIGTRTVAFTATIPASIVPTISAVNIIEAVAGLAAQFLDYVQNKSKLNVATTASGAYSSTIAQIKVTIESKNYIGAAITSDLLTTSGTVAVTVLVTDSRGRTATSTTNITVRAYQSPLISAFSAYRVNGSGVAADDGTSIAIPMNFAIASVNNKNTKAWTLEYRIVGAASWTALASGSVYSYNATFTDLTGLFSGDNPYEIRLRLTDYFTTIEQIVSIGTAFALINIRSNGKGIAFGKISEQDGLEVAMATKFTDTPKVGTNDMWHAGNLATLMGLLKKNLYNNASGSNATITLSETAANFAYLDIHSIDNDGIVNFTRVHSPNGKSVRLGGAVVTSGGRLYIKAALISISGTAVTFVANKHSAQSADTNAYIRSEGATDGAYQKITRIDGWIL